MLAEPNAFQVALLVLVVILVFNLIIFVHELGHFLAAKWRGLQIDRFQIWFGKPLWKKEINGVQYGLGWIPAGGFVALPQMAPMEAIEGSNRETGEALAPISPLDKIIVAFAGPLFSFLLALAAALVITVVGKPLETIPTTTIGYVQPGSPAELAGLQRGDRILAINDQPVESWSGPLDSVFMSIVTSRGEKIRFTIDRPGVGQMDLLSTFTIPETEWWQRRATRQVGIQPMAGPVLVGAVTEGNSPAHRAGLRVGDRLLSFNGTPIFSDLQAIDYLRESGGQPVTIELDRPLEDGAFERRTLTVQPVKPVSPASYADRYMIGASFYSEDEFREEWIHPGPLEQVTETIRQMWITITTVSDPKSSLGIQHLSGPVGIGKLQYFQLLMDHPVHRLLGFLVLINVNLAIFNLLPLPVLDGGHITIATMEAITRRPVRARFLEAIQVAFVFLLFGVMLYVTSKDVFDNFGLSRGGQASEPIVFPDPG